MLQRRRCRGRSNHDMELPFTIKNKHTNTATNQKLLHKRSITINNNNNSTTKNSTIHEKTHLIQPRSQTYHPHRGAEHHAPSSPFPLLPHRSNTIFRARAVSCHMSISGLEVIGCCSGFLLFVFLFSRSAGYPTRMMDVGLCACSCASVLNHEPKKRMS